MEVTCGTDWNTGNGNRRNYSVALNEADLREIRGDEFVDGLTKVEKLRELNRAADLLVVGYLAQEGAITADYADQRIRELKAR